MPAAPPGRRRLYQLLNAAPFEAGNVPAPSSSSTSQARCLAALDAVTPESGYQVNVNFLKPVYLPSTVNFYAKQEEGRHNFCLYDSSGEHRHLQGSIS